MGKLVEDFKKFDNIYKKRAAMIIQKQQIEEKLKDNEDFNKYLKILNDLEKQNDKIDKLRKGTLYDDFILEEVDCMDGQYVSVSLKKPYMKRTFNTEKFIKKYPIDSNMYKTYFYDKEIKGSLTITPLY